MSMSRPGATEKVAPVCGSCRVHRQRPLAHNWVGFCENLPERLDRLIGEQRKPPVVVGFPDCFTRFGGNQYINSASMGAWEDFLPRDAAG
jgi:hypothetical protein